MEVMTDASNFCYKVMCFDLKNIGATYQRMMNKVLKNQIRNMVEVKMGVMIVHIHAMRIIFYPHKLEDGKYQPNQAWRYNQRMDEDQEIS